MSVKTYYRDESRPLGLTVLKRDDRDAVYVAGRGYANIEIALSRVPLILKWARVALVEASGLGIPDTYPRVGSLEVHKDDVAALITALMTMMEDKA